MPSSTKKREGVGERKKMDMKEEREGGDMKEEYERAERGKLRKCTFWVLDQHLSKGAAAGTDLNTFSKMCTSAFNQQVTC